MSLNRILLAGVTASVLFSCGTTPVTYAEASEALTESSNESDAANLASNTIDISTNFTLGMGATNALNELKAFIESQLSCANITLQGSTMTVDYGAKGTCLFHGLPISGRHAMTIMKNEDTAEVQHIWTDLSNSKVKLSGTATVTWSKTDKSRHITYQLAFTKISTGVSATGTGDITEKILDETMSLKSPENGLKIDGTRSWTGPKGTWKLTIDGIQLRWKDPIPFTGSYTIDTPALKTVTMTFTRIDDTTIDATLEGGRKTYHFKVHETGAVESAGS
jgi:hypothetical protein